MEITIINQHKIILLILKIFTKNNKSNIINNDIIEL